VSLFACDLDVAMHKSPNETNSGDRDEWASTNRRPISQLSVPSNFVYISWAELRRVPTACLACTELVDAVRFHVCLPTTTKPEPCCRK